MDAPSSADVDKHETSTRDQLASPRPAPSSNARLPWHFSSATKSLEHSPSTRKNSGDERQPSNSQPMTRTASPSSTNSAKDPNPSDSAPYETRSKIRGNVARPNYSDDFDLESEPYSAHMAEAAVEHRAVSTQSPRALSPKAEAGPSKSQAPTAIRLNYSNNDSSSVAHSASGSVHSAKSSAPSLPSMPAEKKKRKYERHQLPQPPSKAEARSGNSAIKENIPGTSQFFALPNTEADSNPAKKRKTSDGLGVPPSMSSGKQPASRLLKQSSHESRVVTFEKSKYAVKNDVMHADDGTTYSVNGTTLPPSLLPCPRIPICTLFLSSLPPPH